ncbi:dienelactone hydrolase family protein [Catellatospora vulcania]|uniref:dienelactone hydrolase family protein n=1 Tax=Catellatospora vulcania TaxID=1460450 RepID=UPI001E33211F|nr:dienelactone hydrolase family protein [Catellatospora vulcania]
MDEGTSGDNGTAAEVVIPVNGAALQAHLAIPSQAAGIVVFVHGSGSSRHSPRNQYVARLLRDAGLGTLLFDLLNESEENDRGNVFDIGLLAGRLTEVLSWLRARPAAHGLPVGLFGASTGAAAALWAASNGNADVAAVVSRGGRPDLAGGHLAEVRAPTLLIVGGLDHTVLELNERAAAQLTCEHAVEIVPGATHLFQEPGTLQQAAALARDWLVRYVR